MTEEFSTDIEKKVYEQLNQEKWTRATLSNYTINNFKELDVLLEEINATSGQDAIKNLCDEHLHHTKNSIIALYLSGVLNLAKQVLDDANLVTLVGIFADNHKWSLVEYLCNRILSFGENKYALRVLADCHEKENEPEKKFAVWERLIRVDYDEADIVKILAERAESNDSPEEAIDYYKKAIHRYINKKLFSNIRDIWTKLISLSPDETEFFYHVIKRVAKNISNERAIQLLEDLYPQMRKHAKWDAAIELLRKVLEYDDKNQWARKEIVEAFRKKYSDHSQLEEYIRLSNLTQPWRNVFEALTDFEKHIAFDEGNFVFHRAWGVGRIKSIKGDTISIDFVQKRDHSMKLSMAVSALTILGKNHIWVLKSTIKKEKLAEKMKKDIPWALRTIIKSLDNAADLKKIKAEMVPSILTPSEWNSWSLAARKILKTDTNFGNLSDKADFYLVREQPISYDEKVYNRFKAEKNFFSRVSCVLDYIFTNEAEPEAEYFSEMFEYFMNYLRSWSQATEYVVASALLLKKIIARYPYLNPESVIDLKTILESVEDLSECYQNISDLELKREFLVAVRRNLKNWPDVYKDLFPLAPSRIIIDELQTTGNDHLVEIIMRDAANNYKEKRELFVWFVKNLMNDAWLDRLDLKQEKVLIALVHILGLSYRDIENKREAPLNRKINRQVHSWLFKEGKVSEFFKLADREAITRLFTLIQDMKDLEASIRIELRHLIVERFPDFRFYGESEKETVVSNRGFMATAVSHEAKQKALQNILEVEVSANSREIAEALSHGDLRENAEYKAAKEKQEILNATAAKLKDELDRVQVIHEKDVDTAVVGFGTVVRVMNNKSKKEETYTILGPWESEPSKGIISYHSPLGAALCNHKKGEVLSFVINEQDYKYTIKEITKASFH